MDASNDAPEPRDYRTIGRRELIRRWLPPAAAALVLGGAGLGLRDRAGRHQPPDPSQAEALTDWRVDPSKPGRIAVSGGRGPAENLRQGLQALGGIEGFIRSGESVAIKPNCAWDRRPEQAANTNPDVVAELVRLCLAAGASSVVVIDNSCHDPARSFKRSGIGPAAREAGAKIAHQGSASTAAYDLGGTQLGPWEVLEPIAGADRVINVPIVKHHSLARATLGMKNWFGAVVGRRNSLHQRLDQVSAELGAAFRPTLTVVDATRVLTGGGPTGGSLDLVRELDQVAVSTDPVAADAWGGSLLDLGPSELPHIEIAARLGLGAADWASVQVEV